MKFFRLFSLSNNYIFSCNTSQLVIDKIFFEFLFIIIFNLYNFSFIELNFKTTFIQTNFFYSVNIWGQNYRNYCDY